jgi:DtxR family Mn-dependent transcriptional regulator
MTRLLLAVALGVVVLAAGWLARAGVRRFRRGREWRLRVTVEDALKHLYGAEERGRTATIESLAGQLGVAVRRAGEIARLLHERGLAVTADPGAFALTAAGRRAAEQVVRAHRLWERYLADELNVPIAELHRRADRQEHLLGAEDVGRLAAALGHPQRDPHGDPIPPPTATAAREATPGWPVTLAARGVTAQIQHLEDEPEDVFARLAAQELEVGQRVTVRDRASDRLTLDVDGRQIELSPVDAANIFVVPVLEEAAPAGRTLADLQTGERATVRRVNVRGFGRRRLFDLGFTPGVVVECAFAAAFGQPRAYRVRGTTIALRAEQARRIEVDPVPARTPS